MSTFLELCQNTRSEGGMSGTGPTTVVNQTGEMGRVVTWVNRAYERIVSKYKTWNFMRPSFSFQTIEATAEYLPTAVDITDHGSWKVDSLRCYLTEAGVSDEQWIIYREWDQFRDLYRFGGVTAIAGRPQWFSVAPDQSLVFHPVPDAEYTVVGERFRRPTKMTANNDVPVIPAEFHDIIMWRALMFYAAYEQDGALLLSSQDQYRSMLVELMRKELPDLTTGDALC